VAPKLAWSGSCDQICNFTTLISAALNDRPFGFHTEHDPTEVSYTRDGSNGCGQVT